MTSWYYLDKKPYLSGLFFGLSLMVRLHLLPLGIILFLYSKEKRKFLFGSAICLPYYGLLLRVPNFADNVFGYHIAKFSHNSGWFSFFVSNLPLFAMVSYSLKNIKDSFTAELVIAYTAFLLIIGSVFEYFFLIINIILCIEGGYALAYSRFKKILWAVLIIWTVVMIFKVGNFVYDTSIAHSNYIDYIETVDGEIMGQSSFASLIALKTNKTIHNLQIDTNFQRRVKYNFTGSLVIYRDELFDGLEFNCSILNITTIDEDNYILWQC